MTDLKAHIELARECWARYSKHEPYHSVVTDPRYKGLDLGGNPALLFDFYSTGDRDVERMLDLLRPWRPPPSGARVLDFGCGVGRLTYSLSSMRLIGLGEYVGVDISPGHLERARARYRMVGTEHVRPTFVLADTVEGMGPFDLAVSRLVLQHLTPPLQEHYIRQIVGELAPNGRAVLHVMTERADHAYVEAQALAQRTRMQMHAIDPDRLRRIPDTEAGIVLLDLVRDPDEHGPGYVHHYAVYGRAY